MSRTNGYEIVKNGERKRTTGKKVGMLLGGSDFLSEFTSTAPPLSKDMVEHLCRKRKGTACIDAAWRPC